MVSRAFSAVPTFVVALVCLGALASCGDSSAPSNETLWVKDNYAQCNEFDEPFRQCLLVSHSQTEPYRHIEGPIEGFDFEEGTSYELEVIRTDDPVGDDSPTYRLIKILSSES